MTDTILSLALFGLGGISGWIFPRWMRISNQTAMGLAALPALGFGLTFVFC